MLKWLSRLLSEGDGEPSLRRYLCFGAFLLCCSLCLLGLKFEMSGSVKDLATTMIVTSFSAVTVGRFAEAMDGK
jgi:dipeptide/tripeptide permease